MSELKRVIAELSSRFTVRNSESITVSRKMRARLRKSILCVTTLDLCFVNNCIHFIFKEGYFGYELSLHNFRQLNLILKDYLE